MSSNWLKDNLFVVAALALPLVVAALFLAATAIPKFLVDDPRHDLVFALDYYNPQTGDIALRFRVDENELFAEASLSLRHGGAPTQRLYRFDAANGDVHRVNVDIPKSVRERLAEAPVARMQQQLDPSATTPSPPDKLLYPVTFPVEETAGLYLLEGAVAPDGYEFDNSDVGNRGLFGELFGMGSSRRSLRVVKGGRTIPLDLPDAGPDYYYYYANASLLGWVRR